MLPLFNAASSRRAKYAANALEMPGAKMGGGVPPEPANTKLTEVMSLVLEKPTTDTDIPSNVLWTVTVEIVGANRSTLVTTVVVDVPRTIVKVIVPALVPG